MNRTVRCLAIFAIGVRAWACKGDPQASLDRCAISSVRASPALIFVDNGATTEVLVDARDQANQAVEITSVSEAAGSGVTFVRDFLYQPVFDAGATDEASCGNIANSSWTGADCLVPRTNPTRLRYEITGTAASASSFSVTINGSNTLDIPVTVTPVVVPVTQGGAPPASGGATIVQLMEPSPTTGTFQFQETSAVGSWPAEYLTFPMDPADLTFVPFVPTPGSSGIATITNVLFTPVAGLSLTLPTAITINAPASTFTGHTSSATAAGPIAIPASGSSGVFYDGWTPTATDQYYAWSIAATSTIIFDMDWTGSADMDLLMTDDPPTAFVCGFGGATGAHPEQLGCETLPAGGYMIRINLYSGDEPGVVEMGMTTQ
jgi:hypothetical protein